MDVANRAVVYPAGHTSRQCSLINDTYNVSVCYRFESVFAITVRFKSSAHDAKTGDVRCRSADIMTCFSRREMQIESFKIKMHRRNAIEGSVSERSDPEIRDYVMSA